MNMTNTLAFVYVWRHLPSMMYYIGSRTAKNCHPNDGYICSSKTIKPLILANPEEWKREIIASGNPDEMYQLESEILQTFDAKNDPMSFNEHNNDGKFGRTGKKNSPEHNEKCRQAKLGKKTGPCSETRKQNISAANKGKNNMTDAQREAIIKANQTYKRHTTPHTEESILKMKQTIAMKPEQVCPYCGKKGKTGVMKRWHFDKCKDKK